MNNGFLRVAVANPEITVADPDHNAGVIIDAVKKADKKGVQLLVFPELCITGSTCGDLFFQKTLAEGAERALLRIAEKTKDADMLIFVGLPVCHEDKLYNVCAAVHAGKILGLVPKANCSAGEKRYFARAGKYHIVPVAGEPVPMSQMLFAANSTVAIGAEIGDDLYSPCSPGSDCAALVTVNLSASGETVGKAGTLRTLVEAQSLKTCSAYIYAGAGRGESTTDAAFSGHGIIAENGKIVAENKPFEDNLLTVADIDTELLIRERSMRGTVMPHDDNRTATAFALKDTSGKIVRNVSKFPFVPEDDGSAELILTIQAEGLRKRMQAAGAKKLVLGVSGGLDSALALLVCLRTLKSLKLPNSALLAISMPGFGTSNETAQNALVLAKESKADYRIIDITGSVTQHLKDIGHDFKVLDSAYENAQARMRTMILMDIANSEGGLVVGTGDLSEAALGWCTYNGDHMSMYGVNASVTKTLVKYLVRYEAKRLGGKTETALAGILGTAISPELLPTKDGEIAQKTEDIIGSYDLNDFFLYYAVRLGCTPQKTLIYTAAAFGGEPKDYKDGLARFYKRFFTSQFKRSCSPDGANVDFSLSPRGGWIMPSDASVKLWLDRLNEIE